MFQIYVQNRLIYNNRFLTQQCLLDAYLNRGYEYYLSASSGEIVRNVQDDISHTFVLLSNLLNFITEMVVSLALVIAVLVINPVMTILVGIVLFFTMLLIAKVAKPLLNKQGRIMQESYTQVNKWLLQMVNGIKVITVGNKKEFFRENFSLHGKCLVRAERWNTLLQNVPRLLIEMASVVSMLIALLVAVCSGMDVSSLIPTIAAFGMAALKLMPSANRISTALNQVAYYEPSLDKLLESLQLIEREKEEKEKEVGTNENIKIEILGGQKEPSCLRLEKEVELRQISYS